MSSVSQLDVFNSDFNGSDVEKFHARKAAYQRRSETYWDFEVVDGFFVQSNTRTDDQKFNYLKEHLGRARPWQEILTALEQLNAAAGPDERYKVLILARHGEGFHNVAHEKYGDVAWNEHWSKLTGDGELVWGPDPLLTATGEAQARSNQAALREEIAEGLALPTKWFVSPFSRAIDTCILSWSDLVCLANSSPEIKEKVRETMGVHTCDKRSPRRTLASKYCDAGFVFEPGFAEEDIYYKDDYRETIDEHAARVYEFYQDVFSCDDHLVSVTSHSGSIRASLLAFGHRPFAVPTGGILPVFVKASRKVSR
ncbi:Piso0_002567 [Millerozyma farinosa CBS 7064]|uniref:Piso0_002567 protein n=1 Tax=Pichia sorbitophila (strain ATCC MYA-4447 / BCRC 22081 / CBS 7064 / NBRC 10061 / NRRL Y-12695) TaxID=559304 RepID=G8YFD9_PICSO|nr:Piso0_002567 [Millerozyma farinosa CBS 7064]